MLISTQALVEVKVGVELSLRCNRFKLVAWFTTFSVDRSVGRSGGGGLVGVESENKAISAFN